MKTKETKSKTTAKDITKEVAQKQGAKYGGLPASYYDKFPKKKNGKIPHN